METHLNIFKIEGDGNGSTNIDAYDPQYINYIVNVLCI